MNTRSTPTRFSLELDGRIILQQVRLHRRNGSSTTIGSRIKVGIIGDLQPGLNSKKNFRSKSKARRDLLHEVIPTAFSLVQEVVFRLPATFNSQAIDGRVWTVTPLTQHVQMRTLCPHITVHSVFVPHLWLKVNLIMCSKIVVSFHLSRAISLAPHRTPSTSSSLCSDAGFLKGIWERTILHYDWRRIWGYADSMSRIHTTSKSKNIPTERVDSFEYANRPSLGCKTLSSRTTSLSWYHDRILVLRPNSFMGSHCEWCQQIRHRNVRRNTHWERSTVHKLWDTCCIC